MHRALASQASSLHPSSLGTSRPHTSRAWRHFAPRGSALAALTAAVLLLLPPLGACAPSESAARAQHATLAADSVLAAADTQTGAVASGPAPQGEPTLPSRIASSAARAPHRALVPLSPLADTIAGRLVFAPLTQVWFTAATRSKRMLIDVGRVDTDVKKTPERLAAYKEAVAGRATLAPDSRFRVHGSWGVEEVTIADYDVWNGRIVAVVRGSEKLDSVARNAGARAPAVAAAELLPPPTYAAAGTDSARTDSARTDSAAAAPADSAATGGATTTTAPATRAPLPTRCVRDSASAPLAARAVAVRDSLDLLLHQTAMPRYEEVAQTVTVQSSQVIGCFLPSAKTLANGAASGGATLTPARGLVLAVSLRDAGREFLQERVVLIDDATGAVTPLRVADLRFKAHDLLAAFDADGDGVDDLFAKGVAEASGATVVLRFDPQAKKFLRLASGFAWENR